MKLKSFHLRGAIGIKQGLDVDSIRINFEELEPGLIAILGPNGAGKTTLVENLTPWRSLFSRNGSLAKQFCLKDSERELIVEVDGHEYRIHLVIDGITGKLESYLYRDGVCLNPDGKEKTYNEAVAKVFGSPDLFYRSLFMPQRRKSFSGLAPVERKELLLQLIGENKLEVKAKTAGDRAKEILRTIDQLQGRKAQLEATIVELLDVEESIAIGQKVIEQREGELASLAAGIDDLKVEIAALEEQSKAQAVIESQIAEVEKRIKELQVSKFSLGAEKGKKLEPVEAEIIVSRSKITAQEKLLDAGELERMKYLVNERETLAAQLQAHVAAHGRWVALNTELSDLKLKLSRITTAAESDLRSFDEKIQDASKRAETLEFVPCQSLADDEACESCKKCPLLEDAHAGRESLRYWKKDREKRLAQRDEQTKPLEQQKVLIEGEIAVLNYDAAAHKDCRELVEAIDKRKPAEYIAAAAVAEEKLAALRTQLANAEARLAEIEIDYTDRMAAIASDIETKKAELAAITGQVDTGLIRNILTKKGCLTELQQTAKSNSDQLIAARKDVEALQVKLEQRVAAEKQSAQITLELGACEVAQADWLDLQQALGKNGGFASILVESVGDEISVFANELLALFGRNWTLEITTVKPSVDGKTEVEGFYVWINTPDGVRELSELSGGEEVLVDSVLYHAFSHYMAQRSGVVLQTKIMDEADGALDPERAMDYVRAVELAHERSGLNHTLIITHRPELQQSIAQRLRLVPGKGVVVERD